MSDLRHDALPPGIPWLTLTVLVVIVLVGFLWPWVALGLLVGFAVWVMAEGWVRERRLDKRWKS